MIAMDSTPAACIAAPEWFWFWFGLLVLVNIATEIALTTIAAATRHLLVLVTSSGHHTIKFINFCNTNKILLALYPPYLIYTLQPLDVSLFSPLARAYSNEVEQFMYDYQGVCCLTEWLFCRMFWIARKTSIISLTIHSV